ncbi:hypothetical protein ACHAXR_010517, partial [Thalassiosira sp. AJA248-18]
ESTTSPRPHQSSKQGHISGVNPIDWKLSISIGRRPTQPTQMLALLAAYFGFGALHELAHLVAASWILPSTSGSSSLASGGGALGLLHTTVRTILGRYSVINVNDDQVYEASMILHAGWTFSLILAVVCHAIHVIVRSRSKHNKDGSSTSSSTSNNSIGIGMNIFLNPILPIAAYVTAMEAIVTDLLGFVPIHPYLQDSSRLICFCGNFGVLLLHPSWLSIDGGRTALDVLERMVNVTMMRGAQSGGVVTFEPTKYSVGKSASATAPPSFRGVRSRVVNAKRTDLSKGIRRKVAKDNTENMSGNLRGYNSSIYNTNREAGRLVKGFFGHTRFATSSISSFEGTHPHRWSERRVYHVYSFASSSALPSSHLHRNIGVENYVTHNGDFDFYNVNGQCYDLEVVQGWLEKVLETPMPATVDSAAIAGMFDLLRTQGSFALSIRYALCLTLPSSKIDPNPSVPYPSMKAYEEIAEIFEKALNELLGTGRMEKSLDASLRWDDAKNSLEDISSNEVKRKQLASMVVQSLCQNFSELPVLPVAKSLLNSMGRLSKFVSFDVEDADLVNFVQATIDAFFDNDLLHSTRIFLQDAKGSFGLMISSTLDAHRQVCFAARGQTMSIGFYPRKGIICYGSEQAAVKVGMNYENPGGNLSLSVRDWRECDNAVRLDLDDLGGEICLLDWGYAGDSAPAISPPNRNLKVEKQMNFRGFVNVVLLRQSEISKPLSKRMTLLEKNEFIKPLLDDCDDPVLADIRDIPKVCQQIQDDWHDVGLNRMTAWNLASCIRARMQAHVDGKIKCHGGQIDILVTGCEVSLWAAEQFVTDLQKCFPQLFIRAVSSNKLLGLFGQELVMPCTGFPYSEKSMDMIDPIVMIVSHSGGTFGPLACSNLLQSFSSSIFAVTSEWDTQVGKQLRSMYSDDLLSSRIFSTEVGVRPAEPCSVSVVATHQLLTNIFMHICVTIVSDPYFSKSSGAVVTSRDLQVLERCNQRNITALEEIVGVDRKGDDIHERRSKTEPELRSAGNLWAEHILENAKAYIMSFFYVVVTVTTGYPLISGLAKACGLTGSEEFFFFIIRFLDSLIYFWLPQINIIILRLVQGRNLRHRMVGRTVVIGDCPWVAQSAEAFLSKIFACSYSIAGLNVLSGNPADHLVHRHTHRVVRGSLLVCGRPDGRLPALTSLEASTCLSVNQASSIQSMGGTCESITIGHNKSKLPLSHKAIYLKSHRPLFLSEKILDSIDAEADFLAQRRKNITNDRSLSPSRAATSLLNSTTTQGEGSAKFLDISSSFSSRSRQIIDRVPLKGVVTVIGTMIKDRLVDWDDNSSLGSLGDRSRVARMTRSSASLLGAYVNLERGARKRRTQDEDVPPTERVSHVIDTMIMERQGIENTRRVFNEIDEDGDGVVTVEEFITAYQSIDSEISRAHLEMLFKEADIDDNGTLSFEEFLKVARMPNLLAELGIKNRDKRGLVQVQASKERYFGEDLRNHPHPGVNSMAMSQSQHFSMELYEARVASLQRFVAMTVMFHQMGMRVQSFFPKISFGLLGYRMDRTHSIMRIATTASPVSGADVRDKMEELRLMLKIQRSVQLIARTWKKWKNVES